jgi:hypothetical protein
MSNVPFKCPRCEYDTNVKQNMVKHLHRTRLCPNKHNVELTEDVKECVLKDRIYHISKSTPKPKPSPMINCENTNIIYVIKLREHINNGEPIYKFGRTNKRMSERMANYPKGSEVIFTYTCINVSNCQVENLIKEKLKENDDVLQRVDLGLEYFECEILVALRLVLDLIVECEST